MAVLKPEQCVVQEKKQKKEDYFFGFKENKLAEKNEKKLNLNLKK